MAITWGGWHGRLRVGIEYVHGAINWDTSSTTMWCDVYVQCDASFNFNDAQTINLSGAYSGSWNFQNNLQANQMMKVANPSKAVTPGSFHSTRAWLSGAYNGAAPEVTVGYTVPNKPPPPNSAPYAPTLNNPAAGAVLDGANAVTFSWTFNDPDGGPQTGYVLMLKRPNGQWYRWNGSDFIVDDGAAMVASGSTSVTIPAGKIPNIAGVWQWQVHTRDNWDYWGPNSAARNLYFSTPPVASVTAPAHPSTTARPAVTWTYTDAEGTAQNGWQAQIVKSSVYSAAGYNPESWTGQTWGYSGSGTATQATPDIDLPNHTTLRAYVKLNSSPNPTGGLQYSQWAFKQFDLHVPPFASSITFPSNGGVVDLQAGFTMTWTNSFYVGTGGASSSQAAFAIRRKQGTAAYEWWNGTNWQATEFFLSGTNPSYAFRANEVTNAVAWTFNVAIRDGYGGQSPYSTGVTVTGSTAAQVTVVDPSAVVTTINPVVRWSMFDVENDPQQTYQVRIIHKSVYDLGINDPLTAAALWDSLEIAEATTRQVEVPIDLENGNSYRAYVRVKTTGVYSGWSFGEFVVSLQPPAQPDVTLTVLDADGAVQIDIQGRDSLLALDTARAFGGWTAVTNSTITGPVTYVPAQSEYAMRFQSLAAGDQLIRTTEHFMVTPGLMYTGAASVVFAGGGTAKNFRVDIEWLNSALAVIGTAPGSIENDAAAARSYVEVVAPDDAAYARLLVRVIGSSAANEQHDMFDPVLRPGRGIEWSPGGLLGNTSVSIIAQNPYRIVRRGLNIPMPAATQQMTIFDEEIPIGKPQVYGAVTRAVYPNAILASATTMSEPVTWTSGWLWLSDPLRSNSGRAWGPQSFSSVTRPVRQGKFRPIGRPDAVLTTGTRGLREGGFTLVTHTREEREAFDELSDRSEIILMRIPPDQGETEGETMYVRFEGDSPFDRPLPSRTPHRTIDQKWVEQRRPVSNLEWDDNLILQNNIGIQVFIGLDSDGVPYYDDYTAAEQSTVAIGYDSDGALIFQSF